MEFFKDDDNNNLNESPDNSMNDNTYQQSSTSIYWDGAQNDDTEQRDDYYFDINNEDHINSNIYNRNSKRKSSEAGCIVGALVAVLVVVLIISVVIAIFIPGHSNENPGFSGSAYTSPSPTEDNIPTEKATPLPVGTKRPMTEYDGKAPSILDTTNPFPDIIDGVVSGVVSVYNYSKSAGVFSGTITEKIQGTGSGFIISSEGYVITNAHVIQDAAKVSVVFNDNKEVNVDVIGYDTSTDIAVLKFDPKKHAVSPLCLGDSSTVRVGEFVITIGDPSGRELAGTITFGIISAVDRIVNIDGRRNTYIQTDAAMNPGNSGGPLINIRGEVIGLNSAKTVTASYDANGNAISAEGLGFAIPINTVKTIIETLITNGKIERPGIGVSISPATEEELVSLNVEYGLVVREIIEGGPCDKAGLEIGDLIISCNGKETRENTDLTAIIQNKSIGDSIIITAIREGQTKKFIVVLDDLNSMG